MATLDLSRTVAAPPATVWEVVADYPAMADYTRFRRVEIEREGEPAPNGVGAIRALHLLGPPTREEIVAFEPPHLLVYRLISGAPLKDHVGTIELAPTARGTRMSYVIETTPTVPLLGAAVIAVVRRLVEETAAGIAERAETRAR